MEGVSPCGYRDAGAEREFLNDNKVLTCELEEALLTGLQSSLPTDEVYEIGARNAQKVHINSLEMYRHMHSRSLNDAENFWGEMGNLLLRWHRTFSKACSISGGSKNPFTNGSTWFSNGKLNVCDNCVDRWAESYPDRPAVIWEPDEINEQHVVITYGELLRKVCQLANLLKLCGVRKGETVTIYLPMIPEVLISMLACTRLGAVHSVVFAGFSAISLSERIRDARSRILITANHGQRGGKIIKLKDIADQAMELAPNSVQHCILFRRKSSKKPTLTDVDIKLLTKGLEIGEDKIFNTNLSSTNIPQPNSPVVGEDFQPPEPLPAFECGFASPRDIDGDEMMRQMRPYCPMEFVDSEDSMFLLYTSGSTGSPKGVEHTTAGYLLYAAMTHKYVFDIHKGDTFACVADVGWITGHSYVVYGPLCNGVTTIVFESVPTYPNPSRYWHLVEKYRATQFYTAPTSIRTLMKFDPAKYVLPFALESLRILGSVGEPLNPEAWRWYNEHVGRHQANIVDTYWQTETGGHVMAALPGAFPTKPGSVTLPFFGIDPIILDPHSGKELQGNNVHGVLCFKKPWPGIIRTVHCAYERFLYNYLIPYPGYYFTGDGALRDKDGYFWITGRVDDTLNISGHRIGAAEIEHAFLQHPQVAESAVIGVPHDIKGTTLFCFVTLKTNSSTQITPQENNLQSENNLEKITDNSLEKKSEKNLEKKLQNFEKNLEKKPQNLEKNPQNLEKTPKQNLEKKSEKNPQIEVALEKQIKNLREHIRNTIGTFATPEYILITENLPKTRSGKILRRILRKVATLNNCASDDLSTLTDPAIIDTLLSQVKAARGITQ